MFKIKLLNYRNHLINPVFMQVSSKQSTYFGTFSLNTIIVGFIGFHGHLSNNYEIRKASKRTPPSILIVYHLLEHAPPPNLANVGIAIISFSYSGYLIVWLTLISMNHTSSTS